MPVAPTSHLRPLGMGQLLDQAIRLYRRNFLQFIGITAIVQIPLGLLQMGSSLLTLSGLSFPSDFDTTPPQGIFGPQDMFGSAYILGILGSAVVAILSFVLIQVVATAAMTRAVAATYLGESIGITDAYRQIGRSWLSLLGAMLLAILAVLGLVIWFIVPCVGWLTGLGMLVFFSLVVIPLIAPVIVLEKQKATRAIRRAWDLARRRFWWVLGFVLILAIFAHIIITGPVLLLSLLFNFVVGSGPLATSTTQAMTQTVLQSITQLVGGLIYLPLQITAITLMYFDLRIRTEGFDLTVLTESVSAESRSEFSEITTQAPEPERGNLVTINEMGYFVLIEIGAVVLYFIIVAILGAFFFALFAAGGGPGF